MIVGVLTVIFTAVLKKQNGELSILLSLGATLLIGLFFLPMAKPVLAFAEELRQISGLDRELLEPMFKCLGIGLISQICVNICTDSGQGAVGKMIEISGNILCLYVSIPLFRSVLSLFGKLGGGT